MKELRKFPTTLGCWRLSGAENWLGIWWNRDRRLCWLDTWQSEFDGRWPAQLFFIAISPTFSTTDWIVNWRTCEKRVGLISRNLDHYSNYGWCACASMLGSRIQYDQGEVERSLGPGRWDALSHPFCLLQKCKHRNSYGRWAIFSNQVSNWFVLLSS